MIWLYKSISSTRPSGRVWCYCVASSSIITSNNNLIGNKNATIKITTAAARSFHTINNDFSAKFKCSKIMFTTLPLRRFLHTTRTVLDSYSHNDNDELKVAEADKYDDKLDLENRHHDPVDVASDQNNPLLSLNSFLQQNNKARRDFVGYPDSHNNNDNYELEDCKLLAETEDVGEKLGVENDSVDVASDKNSSLGMESFLQQIDMAETDEFESENVGDISHEYLPGQCIGGLSVIQKKIIMGLTNKNLLLTLDEELNITNKDIFQYFRFVILKALLMKIINKEDDIDIGSIIKSTDILASIYHRDILSMTAEKRERIIHDLALKSGISDNDLKEYKQSVSRNYKRTTVRMIQTYAENYLGVVEDYSVIHSFFTLAQTKLPERFDKTLNQYMDNYSESATSQYLYNEELWTPEFDNTLFNSFEHHINKSKMCRTGYVSKKEDINMMALEKLNDINESRRPDFLEIPQQEENILIVDMLKSNEFGFDIEEIDYLKSIENVDVRLLGMEDKKKEDIFPSFNETYREKIFLDKKFGFNTVCYRVAEELFYKQTTVADIGVFTSICELRYCHLQRMGHSLAIDYESRLEMQNEEKNSQI